MAEEKQISKTKRELMSERLKSKYPEREYADDEAMFGQIGDDYDAYEKELGGYKEREQKLTDLLVKDPHSAQFITDMAKGKDPWTSLIERIGIDGVKEMLEDPAKKEEYAAKNQDYMKRLAKSEELEAEWKKNISATLRMLEEQQRERGLSDEAIDQAADWIQEVANDALLGIIKPETLKMALKAINYDADVAEASENGEVRGRNSKVEAELRRANRGGDGTAALGGANNAPGKKRGGESIFELAQLA